MFMSILPRDRARRLAAAAAAAAALGLSLGAAAQSTIHRQLTARGGSAASLRALGATPPPNLVPLQAVMTQAYPTVGANADGSDVWPCYGRATPNGNCPSIGNPAVPLPQGSLVTGKPAHTWARENGDIFGYGLGNGIGCDAYVNGTTGLASAQYKPCAQITTFFEDDTALADDDLLQRVIVTQGQDVIYDSGIVNFGPAGPINYPVDVELYYDVNFGYWPGAENGPNNGNCSPDVAYPLAAPAFPGVIYQVATNSTCVRPVSGPAHVHTVTSLATPSYHRLPAANCTSHNVPSPCYGVTWERKKHIIQDWDIFLR